MVLLLLAPSSMLVDLRIYFTLTLQNLRQWLPYLEIQSLYTDDNQINEFRPRMPGTCEELPLMLLPECPIKRSENIYLTPTSLFSSQTQLLPLVHHVLRNMGVCSNFILLLIPSPHFIHWKVLRILIICFA